MSTLKQVLSVLLLSVILIIIPGSQTNGSFVPSEKNRLKLVMYEELLAEGKTYKDFKVLYTICFVESIGFNHYDSSGNVLKGKVNPKDIGICQINEFYHLKKSKQLNIDIYKPEGNIEYAVYLYTQNGTKDWSWSKKYWSSMLKKS